MSKKNTKNKLEHDPGWKALEASVLRDLVPKLEASGAAVSFVSPPGEWNVFQALELGFMVLMDKPILVLVWPDLPVPEKMRRVADEVVELERGLDHPPDEQKLKEALARIEALANS